MMSTILMLAVMALAFWFLLIRPAQKKQKDQQQMVSQLAPGVRVMTTAGIVGTVRHMGTKQAIIEIAPGVEMTLLKQAIMRVVDPGEEEFEYDDVDAVGEPAVLDDPAAFDRPAHGEATVVEERPLDGRDETTGFERPDNDHPKSH